VTDLHAAARIAPSPAWASPQPARRRVLIFHDSPDFGGHEKAFLTWLPAVLASPLLAELSISLPRENRVFAEALSRVGGDRLRLFPSPFAKQRGEPYRAPLRLLYRRHVQALLRRQRPDVVLLLQGRIENTLVPLLATPRGIDLVSYLPMAHALREAAPGRNVAGVGDLVRRPYYARPRFIVPSQAVARQVREAGGRGTIHVVRNAVSVVADRPDQRAARRLMKLPDDGKIALFIGRFDAHQKGLDLLVQAVSQGSSRLGGWHFVFVGDGPARPMIDDLCRALRGPVTAHSFAWTDRPQSMMAAADLLLLPSRFEGVPLAMLEAQALGLPILASDIDVYREYLPEANRFDFRRADEFPARLQSAVTEPALGAYRQHALAQQQDASIERSASAFEAALLNPASDDCHQDRAV